MSDEIDTSKVHPLWFLALPTMLEIFTDHVDDELDKHRLFVASFNILFATELLDAAAILVLMIRTSFNFTYNVEVAPVLVVLALLFSMIHFGATMQIECSSICLERAREFNDIAYKFLEAYEKQRKVKIGE